MYFQAVHYENFMYIPKHFEVTDTQEIYAFIEHNAFGQLISNCNGQLSSTHIPFLLSDDKTKLIAHLAKSNPQSSTLHGQQVLITLQGPHDYISPSWLSGPAVPTWNYQAVHVNGTCRIFENVYDIKQVVDQLTAKYESGFETPWLPEYMASMLHAIVGVEISISDLQCKYKLSQNRSVEDQRSIVRQLQISGSNDLATAMTCNGSK